MQLAREKGYETFVVPDDVGGRYSVLTPVGLLPIAAAGADIRSLLGGAADALREYLAAPRRRTTRAATPRCGICCLKAVALWKSS